MRAERATAAGFASSGLCTLRAPAVLAKRGKQLLRGLEVHRSLELANDKHDNNASVALLRARCSMDVSQHRSLHTTLQNSNSARHRTWLGHASHTRLLKVDGN